MATIAPDDPGRPDRTERRVHSRRTGALILALVGVLVWLGVHTAVPRTANLPVTIPYFAAILTGIGLVFLASAPAGIVLLLTLGLGWRFVEGSIWALICGILGSRSDGYIAPGGDLLYTYTPILVVAASFALAVWWRPPGRTADGRPILATRAVNRLAVPAILLGPPAGLMAWYNLAPADVYGRPLGIGLLVGIAGLLLFTAYSAFYRLVGRPALGVVLAAA